MIHNDLFKAVVLALLTLTISSCTDQKLASSINGTWRGSMTIANDDQSREQQIIYDKFEQDGNKAEGTLTEVVVSDMSDMDLDNATMDAGYQCYIEGTWKIADGEFSKEYDVTTLKVKVDKKKIKVHYNNSITALTDLYAEFAYSIFGGSSEDEVVDELQKAIYKELFHQYNDEESSEAYKNLEIDDNTMSYETGNSDVAHFRKVKANLKNIFNGRGSYEEIGNPSASHSSDVNSDSNADSSDKEDSNGLSAQDKDDIADVIKAWDELHSNLTSDAVNDVYAPSVAFYGMNLNRSQVYDKISDLSTKASDYNQDSHDFSFSVQANGDVLAEFTKSTYMNGKSHDYPSYLVLKRSSNDYGWSILKESDKVTDRNLQK